VRSVTFTSPPSRCEYLPHEVWQLRYELVERLQPTAYMARLRAGWRRFGHAMFRPECPTCRMCRSLRVPVATFRPSTSQRRVWRRNRAELTLQVVDVPTVSRDRIELFERFHRFGEETKGWPAHEPERLELFLENPFPTEEWTYYRGDRLVAVGYVDALPEGLSAIYFFYDPDERHRSPGTYNILSLLDAARTRGVSQVYLGYYVRGCRSLEYKARFRPHELLADGAWRRPPGQ
jgi:arginine-tRNA-protein transferase